MNHGVAAKTSDSTAISLIRMFNDGPDVSFKGSPMAALCGLDPLGPRVLACSEAPASMYLALSQAPPVFEAEIAIYETEKTLKM